MINKTVRKNFFSFRSYIQQRKKVLFYLQKNLKKAKIQDGAAFGVSMRNAIFLYTSIEVKEK